MAPRVAALLVAVAVAAATLAAAPPGAESALTCGQVYSALYPCVTYVRYRGVPAPACCDGIRGLLASATAPADRRAVCRCLKTAAQGFPGAADAAADLPARCGVAIPYKISTSTDCNRVR